MRRASSERVLALYPITRGFAYVLFEGQGALHDWGIRHVGKYEKNARCLEGIEKLILAFDPHTIVIEDVDDAGSRRSARIHRLYRDLEALAAKRRVALLCYPWPVVFRVFDETKAKTRHDLALAITKMHPPLARRLPPKRKIWLPTDPRQALFDAAALAITHYVLER